MTMMPLVYFMTLPSYVNRRRCLLLQKSLHSLCFTMYIVIFLQKYMSLQWYCPYTSFFLILHTTSLVQWLQHWQANLMVRVQITLEFFKYLICLGLAYSSLIHVFINPETSPPPSQLVLVEISSPKNRRWGVQSISIECL